MLRAFCRVRIALNSFSFPPYRVGWDEGSKQGKMETTESLDRFDRVMIPNLKTYAEKEKETERNVTKERPKVVSVFFSS